MRTLVRQLIPVAFICLKRIVLFRFSNDIAQLATLPLAEFKSAAVQMRVLEVIARVRTTLPPSTTCASSSTPSSSTSYALTPPRAALQRQGIPVAFETLHRVMPTRLDIGFYSLEFIVDVVHTLHSVAAENPRRRFLLAPEAPRHQLPDPVDAAAAHLPPQRLPPGQGLPTASLCRGTQRCFATIIRPSASYSTRRAASRSPSRRSCRRTSSSASWHGR